MDSEHRAHGLAPKEIYLYPLCATYSRNFARLECHTPGPAISQLDGKQTHSVQ
jgi:hypothetical protein